MVGTGEIKYPGRPKLAFLHVSLILIYQRLEEEILDQKSPGPPGRSLMQRASSWLITNKKQEMLKSQTPSLGNQTETNRRPAFGFRKMATAVKKPDGEVFVTSLRSNSAILFAH